jgi:hypothetical protein
VAYDSLVNDTASRWVIVVPPAQQALYEVLRRSLKDDGPVSVVYDRRTRRRGRLSSGRERQRAPRRRRGPDGRVHECEVLKIVERAPVPEVVPSAPPPPQACPECGLEVEFDMPPFPQPPARIVIETVHAGAQHHVEIHAFTATGRPLLSQRNPARPRGGVR